MKTYETKLEKLWLRWLQSNMFHTEIKDRWKSLTIFEQMANIGAEVGRIVSWKKKNNEKMSNNALYRALELIDMTIEDKKNYDSLKEILRMREVLVDFSVGNNIYKSTEKNWEKYFFYFNIVARNNQIS